MTQSAPNANLIIWFVTSHPTIVSIALSVIILAFIVLFGIFIYALIIGREINIWVFRIGPKNTQNGVHGQPIGNSCGDSLNSVDKDIRDLVRNLFPGCDDKITTLDRKPKQGQVSRIDYEHVIFGWTTVKYIFDKLPNNEILKMSKSIGEGAATGLCDQIRKRLNIELKEIINTPRKIFGLLSFWDDTGGWGVYVADTENCKTKWLIEITNHFLQDRNVDIAIVFWTGYFEGFARSYCNIRNIQNQNDKSQTFLVPDGVHCVTCQTPGPPKILCTINLIPQRDNQ